jgi:enoyl-[acyl-carrier-protein] reductase (NADH)
VLFEAGHPAPVEIDDVAALVCFLLGDESRRITGTDLAVDAGWSAGKHCPGLPGF